MATRAAAHPTLASLLEAVPGFRKAHRSRYDLPFLLTCLVAALLCHCDGSEAVAQWCCDQHRLQREIFGPHLFLTPSGSLYRWLLPHLDAAALEQMLGTRVLAEKPLTLNVKTVQGARAGEQVAFHLFAFLPSRPENVLANACLGQY